MSPLAPRLATMFLALSLTVSGVILAATASAPTLPSLIAQFGGYA
ncbi:MAG: hypothetical protein ABIW83_09410 [Allosphingosinicella sp.]